MGGGIPRDESDGHDSTHMCCESWRVYAPPMSEFDMLRTRLERGERESVAAVNWPGILFVTSGEGIMSAGGVKFELKKGYVFFIAAGVEIDMEGSSSDKLDVWRATVE